MLSPLPPELNIIDPLVLLFRRCLLGVMYLLDVVDAPLLIDFIVVLAMNEPPAYILVEGFKSYAMVLDYVLRDPLG